jgi:transposase
MLDEATRIAILTLRKQGHGTRRIAQALSISREAVRTVIKLGTAAVPTLRRPEQAEPWREQILELHARFDGHLGRIHEILSAQGATLSYPALTAFCRRHGIGHTPKLPAGRYHFAPGQEMQHDTSPHRAVIGGVTTRVQTASVVLCYSRMLFFQCFPRFTRFECKAFLTAALRYFGGAAADCMVDNSHVIVASGTGADMIPAPEMAAFAARFGFRFQAHAVGDANRSARVEAPFHRIERGFLLGQRFADWAELNSAAHATCEAWNAKYSNKLHASRRELFATERPQLIPLPLHVPEVYQLHGRIVDPEGFVHLHRVRYSVPYTLIGRQLEVRETQTQVEVYHGPRRVAVHARVLGPLDSRVTDPTHRPPRGHGLYARPGPPREAAELAAMEPRLAAYLDRFMAHTGARRAPLRRLLGMLRDYPREAFMAALQRAEQYGLFDLDRLEKLVLKQIAQDFFVLPEPPEPSDA